MSDVLDPALFGEELPPEDGLALLKNDAMRARRRPWAIACACAWDVVMAVIIATPIAAVVRSAYGRHPSGDGPLWSPGGLALGDLLQHTAAARPALVLTTIVILAFGSLLGLVPIGAILASIAFVRRDLRAPSLQSVVVRALFAYRSFLALFAATVSVQLAILLFALVAGSSLSRALVVRVGEARSDQLGVLVTLVLLVVAMVVGVAHDLARAAVIRYRVGAVRGAQLGWNTLRRTPIALVWSWAWRALAGGVPVLMGALVAEGLGGRAGVALAALFVVHQLAIGSRVALHASWLAKALRAVDNAHRVVRLDAY